MTAITMASMRLERVILMNVFLPETPELMAQSRCARHSLNKLSLNPQFHHFGPLVAALRDPKHSRPIAFILFSLKNRLAIALLFAREARLRYPKPRLGGRNPSQWLFPRSSSPPY